MECHDIREHLSGYIDNALDQGEKDIVEKHIADCNACRKELDSLKAMVKEISSVDPVKPPDDFLSQIHTRMDPGFSLASIASKLFVPFSVKIPMQFAATVAVCMLVFFIVNTPEVKKELSDLSQKTPGRGTAEYVFKDALDEEIAVPAAPDSGNLQDDIKKDLADAKEPLSRIQSIEKKMQKRKRADKIAEGTGDMSGAGAITGRDGMRSSRAVLQDSETVGSEKVLAGHEPGVKARIAEAELEKPEDRKYAFSPSPSVKPIEIALVLDRGTYQPSAVTGKGSRGPVSSKKSTPVRKKEKMLGFVSKQESKTANIARSPMEAETIEEDRDVQDYSEKTVEEAEEETVVGAFKNEELRKPGKKEITTAKIVAAHPEKTPEELKEKLHTLVESVKGKVVTISYDNNNRPAALLADIPVDNYKLFCGKLNEIGRFVSPPPTDDMDGNTIRVLVKFVSN